MGKRAPSKPKDEDLAASLEAFAAAIEPSRRCWLCQIPERSAIDKRRLRDDEIRRRTGNLHKGLSVLQLAKWLVAERGYSPEEATPTKVRAHFDRDHHEAKKGAPRGKAQAV